MEPLKLSDLLTDRFQTLAQYFEGITIRDLFTVDKRELIDACSPQHKILMGIFAETKLRETLRLFDEHLRDFSFDEDIPMFEHLEKYDKLNPKRALKMVAENFGSPGLDLRRYVRGKIFLEGDLNLSHILDFLKEKDTTHILYLDISENGYRDDDAELILQLVDKLPKLKGINISGSLFEDPKDFLEKLCAKDIHYVVAIHSFDYELGKQFSPKVLDKLIWLTPACIMENSFEYITPMIDLVKGKHKEYYESMTWRCGCLYRLYRPTGARVTSL